MVIVKWENQLESYYEKKIMKDLIYLLIIKYLIYKQFISEKKNPQRRTR